MDVAFPDGAARGARSPRCPSLGTRTTRARVGIAVLCEKADGAKVIAANANAAVVVPDLTHAILR